MNQDREQIKNGNKKIAEFMGGNLVNENGMSYYKFDINNRPCLHCSCNWNADNLFYHEDYSWLMVVVEKIEADYKLATMMYVNSWDNRGRYCFSVYRELDEARNLRNRFIEIVSDSKIKSIWLGVLEFIWIRNANMIPTSQEIFDKNREQYQRRIDFLQYGE